MSYRQPQSRTWLVITGERRIGLLDRHVHRLRYEGQPGVPEQGAGEELGFAENLEAVADPEDRSALSGVALHRTHDRAEAGDGTRPKVVAVAEAPRQDHDVCA